MSANPYRPSKKEKKEEEPKKEPLKDRLELAAVSQAMPFLLQLDEWGKMDNKNQATICWGFIALIASLVGLFWLISTDFETSNLKLILTLTFPVSLLLMKTINFIKRRLNNAQKG